MCAELHYSHFFRSHFVNKASGANEKQIAAANECWTKLYVIRKNNTAFNSVSIKRIARHLSKNNAFNRPKYSFCFICGLSVLGGFHCIKNDTNLIIFNFSF